MQVIIGTNNILQNGEDEQNGSVILHHFRNSVDCDFGFLLSYVFSHRYKRVLFVKNRDVPGSDV